MSVLDGRIIAEYEAEIVTELQTVADENELITNMTSYDATFLNERLIASMKNCLLTKRLSQADAATVQAAITTLGG